MNILYPLHITGFDTLLDDEKKEAEKSGEDMLCTIIYLESSDKASFSDLNKLVEKDCVLKKSE